MKKIPLTQNMEAIVDDEDYAFLSQWKWFCDRGYACRWEYEPGGKGKKKIVYMHRLLNETPKGLFTDHINGNRNDNRKANLRTCTFRQNILNKKKRADSLQKYKGVHLHGGKYRAQICDRGKRITVGRYESEEEAAIAYNEAALNLFGEFARLNEVQAFN